MTHVSSGVTVGQGKKSVVHSRFAEALTAKLDRGRGGDNGTGIRRIKEKTRLVPTIATTRYL